MEEWSRHDRSFRAGAWEIMRSRSAKEKLVEQAGGECGVELRCSGWNVAWRCTVPEGGRGDDPRRLWSALCSGLEARIAVEIGRIERGEEDMGGRVRGV